MKLWNNDIETEIEYVAPNTIAGRTAAQDKAIIVFPGGAYFCHADHEGIGYAQFLAAHGYHAFVVKYRVNPHVFPAPLLDARRAVRFARAHAAEYGFDPQKIAVMGSSAGGHLAALVSTYTAPLDGENTDEIDTLDCRPNAQILCYPVICSPKSGVAHVGSYENLLGFTDAEREAEVDPSLLADEHTPPAFVYHTHTDQAVEVCNTYRYGEALRHAGVLAEVHVFPEGPHGMGLSFHEPHVGQWRALLLNWLERYL